MHIHLEEVCQDCALTNPHKDTCLFCYIVGMSGALCLHSCTSC